MGGYREVLSSEGMNPRFSVFGGHSSQRVWHTDFSFTYPKVPFLDTTL